MKSITFLTSALTLVAGAAATPLKRAGSKSFAGTSVYFLQGLSGDDQQSFISTLADDGVKVVRLWVSDQPGGGSCVKGSISATGAPELETTIGQYNQQTLDLLDQTLVYLQAKGIKAIISPHDGNKLNGPNGNDIYGQTYGAGYFYEQQEAMDAYDARLNYILNYKGSVSGQVWKEWSDAIMAFDLQNEPFSSKTDECNNSAASSWICGRAQTLRNGLGSGSPIKVATGGLGGDISHGCTFVSQATGCDAVDIISVHRYAGPESSNQGQWAGSYSDWQGQANGKLVHLEEWGVNVNNLDPNSEFPANTEDMNSAGLPWTYWQLLPSKKCDSNDGDGFGFFIDSGVDVKSQIQAANNANSPQDWSFV